MKAPRKPKAPKVGECAWCGHWGRLWGRWCRHPFKPRPTQCREKFMRWVFALNRVARPLPDRDGWTRLGSPNPIGWLTPPANYGRKRKVHRHL